MRGGRFHRLPGRPAIVIATGGVAWLLLLVLGGTG